MGAQAVPSHSSLNEQEKSVTQAPWLLLPGPEGSQGTVPHERARAVHSTAAIFEKRGDIGRVEVQPGYHGESRGRKGFEKGGKFPARAGRSVNKGWRGVEFGPTLGRRACNMRFGAF